MDPGKKVPAEMMLCWQEYERKLGKMSPFEVENELTDLAQENIPMPGTGMLLEAGRGNPNWVASVPREAFLLVGMFGMRECRLVQDFPEGIAGMPRKEGIAFRFKTFMGEHAGHPGAKLLEDAYTYYVNTSHFDPDELLYEWVEAVIGDQYPTPARMLRFCSVIMEDYLLRELSGGGPSGQKIDLFATEGGTAGICYVFNALTANHLLKKGDHIALMTPVYAPFLEIPALKEFNFRVTAIGATKTAANGDHTWQYPDEEMDKLRDKSLKLLCLVNPGNPFSYALSPESMNRLIDNVKEHNPNLMIVTDDVYGTFVPRFRSLMYELPENTLCIYSFSKFFGATGWRLAVTALSEENIYDKMIAELPGEKKKSLRDRYHFIAPDPEKLKFIDRMAAESRLVALYHSAGLSTPQQMQMALFAAFSILDKNEHYKKRIWKILRDRLETLWENTGFTLLSDPLRAGYYSEIDIGIWAKKCYGEGFAGYLENHYDPLDFVVRLARETGVVALNGGGFGGPEWSVRVSLANLDREDYKKVGTAIRQMLDEYAANWNESGSIEENEPADDEVLKDETVVTML